MFKSNIHYERPCTCARLSPLQTGHLAMACCQSQSYLGDAAKHSSLVNEAHRSKFESSMPTFPMKTKNLHNQGPVKGNCSPSQHVNLSKSSFVVWDVRNPNPKITRSSELYPGDIQLQRFRTWAYGISVTPFRG